jgi:hypothetical protein
MYNLDAGIRLKAFSFLEDLCSEHGLALPKCCADNFIGAVFKRCVPAAKMSFN